MPPHPVPQFPHRWRRFRPNISASRAPRIPQRRSRRGGARSCCAGRRGAQSVRSPPGWHPGCSWLGSELCQRCVPFIAPITRKGGWEGGWHGELWQRPLGADCSRPSWITRLLSAPAGPAGPTHTHTQLPMWGLRPVGLCQHWGAWPPQRGCTDPCVRRKVGMGLGTEMGTGVGMRTGRTKAVR